MSFRILLISGSVRLGSVNSAVLATAAELAQTGLAHTGLAQTEPAVKDVETSIYQGLATLPHFNPDLDREPLPEPVAELRNQIANADALLFSTPEYAGAMPGALKNLLEWTIGGTEISDKPSGWINPSSNPGRAERTYLSLRTVLEYTEARLIEGACLTAPTPRSVIDQQGIVQDLAVRESITKALIALWLASASEGDGS
ncbi:NAD(P)H-dependent FMN reductase [Psychromicrobium silvestre]|uniref:NAD(P)H-dependent FMN reductase n=1 Tax=Psychromicrobium silvestre TaxID=1645614 RepID=A0A7Y9S8U0_9MICC|nr:NADPH-dependent FMN reductase [Psychromicrobium silvestre]NYE95677.1 NAD(P)H-dependent FMN reductase [Psychromicrobium silvestre]